MDILNDRNFELNSLVIQTSTIGNIKTLSTFAEKHCKNLEKFTLTALRLPPKGLSLLFRIGLKRIIFMIFRDFVLEVLFVFSPTLAYARDPGFWMITRKYPPLRKEKKKIQKMIRFSFDCMSHYVTHIRYPEYNFKSITVQI